MTDALTETSSRPRPSGAGPIIDAPLVGEVPTPPDGTEPPEPPRGIRPRIRSAWHRFLTMPIEGWVSLVVVTACVSFVFWQLGPGNVLSSTTPAGGDMGAHVWGPAFLRDHLLPQGRLAGWTPDWYAGFPAYQFYMVVPSLAIALLSYVLPYGVAFKLVAISGVLSLPIAAWAFGRLTRLPFPISPLLAVGATAFLFDRSFSIYGGNIASTLAGEFAFSISLTFAVLYLGVLGRGLENGKHRGWAAILLALCGLCHIIPLIFALAGTAVWFLLRPGVARLKYLVTMLPVGGALTAFWILPFYGRSRYLNDMGWEKKENYVNLLFERTKLDPQLVNSPPIKWLLAFAAVGALMAIVFRRRGALLWLAMAIFTAVGFRYAPQGRLWNARLLPFYYLSLYLLAAVGVGEVFRTVASLLARDPRRPVRSIQIVGVVIGAIFTLTLLAMPLHAMPNQLGPIKLGQDNADGSYQWLFLSTKDNSFVDSWARWNFEGYENKAAYPEYHDIVATMGQLGQDNGCGRAMWEHEDQHDRYGTPMALMLLPFWTDGCIGSMEGLYFEASATTPYHFLNQDELSSAPSNAQRDLPYGAGAPSRADFDLGIQHLQMFGVRYYMAISDRMIDYGRRNPDLTEVASSGPWVVFEVADSQLVEGLVNQPAVVSGVDDAKAWLKVQVGWYQDPAAWSVYLADDGPKQWQRINPGDTPVEEPVNPVQVSNISATDDTIEFDVDQIGVPVVVKTSYFPNWKADGADGPWRVSPNLMVVVPTSNHVKLHYGYTALDLGAYGITLLGIVGLFFLFRMRPIVMPPPRRRRFGARDDGEGESDEAESDPNAVPADVVLVDAMPGAPPTAPADEADGVAHAETSAPHRAGVGPTEVDPAELILGPVADLDVPPSEMPESPPVSPPEAPA